MVSVGELNHAQVFISVWGSMVDLHYLVGWARETDYYFEWPDEEMLCISWYTMCLNEYN